MERSAAPVLAETGRDEDLNGLQERMQNLERYPVLLALAQAIDAMPEQERIIGGLVRRGLEIAGTLPFPEQLSDELNSLSKPIPWEIRRGCLVIGESVEGVEERPYGPSRVAATKVAYLDKNGAFATLQGEPGTDYRTYNYDGPGVHGSYPIQRAQIPDSAILWERGLPTMQSPLEGYVGEYTRSAVKLGLEAYVRSHWVESGTEGRVPQYVKNGRLLYKSEMEPWATAQHVLRIRLNTKLLPTITDRRQLIKESPTLQELIRHINGSLKAGVMKRNLNGLRLTGEEIVGAIPDLPLFLQVTELFLDQGEFWDMDDSGRLVMGDGCKFPVGESFEHDGQWRSYNDARTAATLIIYRGKNGEVQVLQGDDFDRYGNGDIKLPNGETIQARSILMERGLATCSRVNMRFDERGGWQDPQTGLSFRFVGEYPSKKWAIHKPPFFYEKMVGGQITMASWVESGRKPARPLYAYRKSGSVLATEATSPDQPLARVGFRRVMRVPLRLPEGYWLKPDLDKPTPTLPDDINTGWCFKQKAGVD